MTNIENIKKALTAYESSTYLYPAETADIITDLLTDLMHFCADNEIDFCEKFENASIHFDHECSHAAPE